MEGRERRASHESVGPVNHGARDGPGESGRLEAVSSNAPELHPPLLLSEDAVD